jgi:hypothetical protein
MRGNYFLEIEALQPFNVIVWFLISKKPKEDLKRPEFFAALRRHEQREGVDP